VGHVYEIYGVGSPEEMGGKGKRGGRGWKGHPVIAATAVLMTGI